MQDMVKNRPLRDFEMWERYNQPTKLYGFDLELTARCNLNCRHCYINVPAGDFHAAFNELSLKEISSIADQAVAMGAIWCLLTGGEPLLRKDFNDIYLALKKKGLLVSVFTNATAVQEKHVELFKKYPPRDIEITVYGASEKTYQRVTRKTGSYAAFRRGLELLEKNNIRVRLKAMALRSNVEEMAEIAAFCREHTKDYFRYDANLHLRFDRDERKNRDIKEERLTPEEVVRLERDDSERFQALEEHCDKYINPALEHTTSNYVFGCGIGGGSVNIGCDGKLRLCSSLYHPEFMFDLRKGTLKQAIELLVPRAKQLQSNREKFLKSCRSCSLVNLCQWCPADAYLETGLLDEPIGHFCSVAHGRAREVGEVVGSRSVGSR